MSEIKQKIFPWEGRILVCANLSYNVTPFELRDFFRKYGQILRVDVERNKRGEANGLAFIEFNSPADCSSAEEKCNGTQFCGRTLKCKVSTKPPPELLRYYIREIDHRPINDRIRQKIIDGTIDQPSGHRPMKIRSSHKNRGPNNFNSKSEKNTNDYSSDYYYYYSDSDKE